MGPTQDVEIGSSGTSAESGRQEPTSTVGASSGTAAAALVSLVFPIPASPVTSSRPAPLSRWRRTLASSSRRPAIRGGVGRMPSAGVVAASQSWWKWAGSPSIASTRARRFPRREAEARRRPSRPWCGCTPPPRPARAGWASRLGGAGRAGRRRGRGASPVAGRAAEVHPRRLLTRGDDWASACSATERSSTWGDQLGEGFRLSLRASDDGRTGYQHVDRGHTGTCTRRHRAL